MFACYSGHLETVHLLLQHGADRHAQSYHGESALSIAGGHPLVQAALLS
jgi:ankyrin repeat protein